MPRTARAARIDRAVDAPRRSEALTPRSAQREDLPG
jgi:hypothetical protein